MNFDFDTLVDRRDSGNMKDIILPEPVRRVGGITYSGAEMDFKTAPVIIEALTRKAQGGLYGYTLCDQNYLDVVVAWMQQQRNWKIQPDWVIPTYGTIQALCAAVRAFTDPGDGVIIQTPVYMRYKADIELNNRSAIPNPLLYRQGKYAMDFDHLELCMAQASNKMLVLCNPHNPIAKVWPRPDLERLAALAKKYHVLVFTDEIFAEVIFPGHECLPYSTISGALDNCIVSTSLGKAFNFTGFSHANMIIPNPDIRRAFRKQRDIDHYGSIDPFLYAAISAAYREGGPWLEAMVKYVYQNARLIGDFFAKNLPQLTVVEAEGSYVIWIDWRSLGLSEDALFDFLVNEAYLDLDHGSEYGVEGIGFTRMNIAAPRAEIEKSLARLLFAAQKRGFVK